MVDLNQLQQARQQAERAINVNARNIRSQNQLAQVNAQRQRARQVISSIDDYTNQIQQVQQASNLQGVRESSIPIINQLIQRRVAGEPLGYGVIGLNQSEMDLFESISRDARQNAYSAGKEFQLSQLKGSGGIASSIAGKDFVIPGSSQATGNQALTPQQILNQAIGKTGSGLPASIENIRYASLPPSTVSLPPSADYNSNVDTLNRLISKATGKAQAFLVNKGLVAKGSPLEQAFDPRSTASRTVSKYLPSPGMILQDAFLAPAFATNTAQTFSEVAVEQLSPLRKKKILLDKAKEIEELFDTPTQEAANRQIDAIDNFRRMIGENFENKEYLEQLNKFMEQALGKKGNVLFRDLVEQEKAIRPEIVAGSKIEQFGNIPSQKGAVFTSSISRPKDSMFAGTGQYERTDNVVAPVGRTRVFSRNSLGQYYLAAQGQSPTQLQRPKQLSQTRQDFLNRQQQNNRQTLGQRYLQQSRQLPRLEQALRQRQQQRQRNEQTNRNRPRTRLPIRPRIPRLTRKPFQPVRSKIRSTPEGFDVYSRQGKKLTTRPLTAKSAFGFGAKSRSSTIKASYLIVKSNKPGFRSASLERIGERLAYQYRPSKRIPGLIVEKSKYRLNTRTEVAQIQAARKSKLKFRSSFK